MRVFAPGKLVLLGEYAVLDGAPALVAAIDRGVCCEVTPGDGIRTPRDDDRFVRRALERIQAPKRLYRFSDWNPVELADKPGFGGSAAAVVAACVAGGLDGPTLADVAVEIHRQVQGSGSGVDVRASAMGGVRPHTLNGSGRPVPCPALSVVYSGRSARTGPRVAQYRAWKGRQSFVDDSAGLLLAFAHDPIRTVQAAYGLLESMARQAGVDWATPEHERIAQLAADVGGAAKPSGAGGGDVAIALFPDRASRAQFEAACGLEGLTPIQVQVVPGVRVES